MLCMNVSTQVLPENPYLPQCSMRDIREHVADLLSAHDDLMQQLRDAGHTSPMVLQQLHEVEYVLSIYETEVRKIQLLLG